MACEPPTLTQRSAFARILLGAHSTPVIPAAATVAVIPHRFCPICACTTHDAADCVIQHTLQQNYDSALTALKPGNEMITIPTNDKELRFLAASLNLPTSKVRLHVVEILREHCIVNGIDYIMQDTTDTNTRRRNPARAASSHT